MVVSRTRNARRERMAVPEQAGRWLKAQCGRATERLSALRVGSFQALSTQRRIPARKSRIYDLAMQNALHPVPLHRDKEDRGARGKSFLRDG